MEFLSCLELLRVDFGSLALAIVEAKDQRPEAFEFSLHFLHGLHVVHHGRGLEGALVVGQARHPRDVDVAALLHDVDRLLGQER